MQAYLAQSEVCITQSLINPHFLFNCLNTISSMEYLEGAFQSREATQLVATFLRDALSRVGSIVTIREEMDHIQRYIEIQKLRFEERISYEIETEEECLEAQIPSMSLQPVIENAIVHGVGDQKKDGRVSLKSEETRNASACLYGTTAGESHRSRWRTSEKRCAGTSWRKKRNISGCAARLCSCAHALGKSFG